MSKIDVNGIKMEYQRHGPDNNEAESIVFAHGAGGNLLSWFQQIPYFSRKYDCVVFSHRGFGHSYDLEDGPGMEAFADDLRGLVDALGIERFHHQIRGYYCSFSITGPGLDKRDPLK